MSKNEESASANIIVIGGGVLGKSVALEIANKGIKVLCVDSGADGSGTASQAAGAMLGAFGEVVAARRGHDADLGMRVESARIYEDWLGGLNSSSSVALQKGTFMVANSVGGARDTENLNAIVQALEVFGEPYQVVEPASVPGLKASRHHEAHRCLFLPNEGYVDATSLAGALEDNLRRSPVCEQIDDFVEGLLVEANRVVGVAARHSGQIRGDHIVVCAGVGTQGILNRTPEISLQFPKVVAGKGFALLVRTDEDFPYVIRTPNRDFACGTHVVPRAPGVSYLGATNRIWSELPQDDGAMLGEVHFLLESALNEINMDLRLARVEAMLYGSRPVTADRIPLVGRTDIDGLSIATGTYRNGILLAPVIAKIVAQEILGTNPEFENPFSPRGRRVDTSREHLKGVLDEAIRDFVSFLQEPGGRLPYNRTQELEDFLRVLMSLALTDGDEFSSFRSEAEHVLTSYPLPEILPELFYRWHYASRRQS